MEKLYHRQVHPNFVLGDQISVQVFEISSQVFLPGTDDKVSVYNGSKFTAKEAYENYLKKPNVKTAGVCSVSLDECNTIDLEVDEDNDPFDGHASIDMSNISGNQKKVKATRLRNFAQDRGWTYKPN